MRVFVRTDASTQIGTGHLMRCLTLADELKSRGAEITFITRAHPGNMGDAIKNRGYKLCLLPVPADTYKVRKDDVTHASWLEVSWEQDAEDTRQAIGGSKAEWLIVDHYGIDARWHRELRKQVGQIIAIDDLADRPLDCDMLLDQTYGRQEDDYQQWVPSNCQMLLGSRYALLRPEFLELRPVAIEKRKVFNGINRVLVSMGGMDPDNVTATVLEGLSEVDWKYKPVIDVVLGGGAPHIEAIVAVAKKSSMEVFVSTDVSDMAQRMLAADIAFGAGGATSWERCCMGLPTLAVTDAENQVMILDSLARVGAINHLGWFADLKLESVAHTLRLLDASTSQLMNMSSAARAICDGQGTRRVVEHLSRLFPAAKNAN